MHLLALKLPVPKPDVKLESKGALRSARSRFAIQRTAAREVEPSRFQWNIISDQGCISFVNATRLGVGEPSWSKEHGWRLQALFERSTGYEEPSRRHAPQH